LLTLKIPGYEGRDALLIVFLVLWSCSRPTSSNTFGASCSASIPSRRRCRRRKPIEGHGGMLDHVDSVVFAAPVFFHATRYWWT
jgi:predicted CDP-diglyceride synthetase/phosphatidate cytidylyltransferase